MRRQSLLSLVLLTGYLLSSVEVVMGEIRDGDVHHESNVTALDHSAATWGEHGHEHESVPEEGDPEEQGSEHDHGTPVDHCTHTHGVSCTSGQLAETIAAELTIIEVSVPVVHSDIQPDAPFHPPRV